MDAATEASVLRRYPKAKLIVLALDGKVPPKKRKGGKGPKAPGSEHFDDR
jgi:hypothetical protein